MAGWTQTHTHFALMGGFYDHRGVLKMERIGESDENSHPELFGRSSPQGLSHRRSLLGFLLVRIRGFIRSFRRIDNLDLQESPPPEAPLEAPLETTLEAPPKIPIETTLETSPEIRSESPLEAPPKAPSEPLHCLVTKDDICDRSKNNTVAKLLTVAQTTWFLTQFIRRWVTQQPTTQLEVMTVAYTVLNVIIYAAWWNRPYSIGMPINASSRTQDEIPWRTNGVSIWDVGYLIGWGLENASGLEDIKSDLLPAWAFAIGGTLFGGLHCLAWRYDFPTRRETILWRVCAVYCTVYPLMTAINIYDEVESGLEKWEWKSFANLVANSVANSVNLVRRLAMGLFVYIICRLILIAITLSSLRAPSAGIFEATSWTNFIPHFG